MTKKRKKLDKTLSSFFKKVEGYFTPKGKVLIGTLLLTLIGFLGYGTFMGTVSPAWSTVMISNLAQTTGGSGVIFKSGATESQILTNAHICAVVEKGGWVKTINQENYLVDSYIISPDHDVCLLKVKVDLGMNTDLATHAPEIYDYATVSGHPALLPNIVSKGHFAAREVIHLLSDIKDCEQSDYDDPDLALICAFFGKLPIFQAYESTVVTAMIMGGSSGSAVYNWRNQISGLVFAGQGKSLSFAFVVPYEYVANFVQNIDQYKRIEHFPEYTMGIKEMMATGFEEDGFSESLRHIKSRCEDLTVHEAESVKDICGYVGKSTLWLKE